MEDEKIAKTNNPVKDAEIQVVISEDGLTAVLKVTPVANPVNSNEFTLTKTVPFTVANIFALLQQHGVVYGIKHDIIHHIVSQVKEGEFIVAEGDTPEPGTGESTEEIFSNDIQWNQFMEHESHINFREHQIIPQVEPGDILAIKKPGTPGKSGKAVSGEVIPAPIIETITLKALNGVQITDNRTVIATEKGRPGVVGDLIKYYSVLKLHCHSGDVNMETGNVHFNGELIINGNICECMEASATGNIIVNGNVYGAKVIAGLSIHIHGSTANSTLIASSSIKHCSVLAEKIQEFYLAFIHVLKKVSLLQRKTSILNREKFIKVMAIIIQKQYPNLFKLATVISEEVSRLRKSLDIPYNFLHTVQRIKNMNDVLLFNIDISVDEVLELLANIDKLNDYFYTECMVASDITLGNVLQSIIRTNGDVHIKADECFHTDIFAEGNINAHCVVRGGTLDAKKNIYASEVGSELGIKTMLRVPDNRQIQMNHVFENTEIYIGPRKYCVTEEKRRVKFMQTQK